MAIGLNEDLIKNNSEEFNAEKFCEEFSLNQIQFENLIKYTKAFLNEDIDNLLAEQAFLKDIVEKLDMKMIYLRGYDLNYEETETILGIRVLRSRIIEVILESKDISSDRSPYKRIEQSIYELVNSLSDSL